MMTGRERTQAALRFSRPDRAPRDLWALPGVKIGRRQEYEALQARFPLDISSAAADYPPSDRGLPEYPQPGAYRDHWGSVWHVGEAGVIGEVKAPALADWSCLATYHPPMERLAARDFAPVQRLCEESDAFILSEWTANPFERLQFLRGTEALFVDIAYGAAEFRTLLAMVHEYNLRDITGWCATPVDGIVFSDDWGSNRALLIRPSIWRAIFKPLYREYVELIHAAGKFAFFHSDGQIAAIFGDLVSLGIDAINAQLFTMDIEQLGRDYGGKVAFWGEIDRQRILPFGSPDDVRVAVQRVRSALGTADGGLIALCEWGKRDPAANIHALYEAWLEPPPNQSEVNG